jgi:pantoate--beta-alanine ligase
MEILRTIAEMRAACARAAAPLGLVPTMGALHEGHRSLVRAARQECASVAVTIFVNPTQFAPGEDLARYPRTFAEDCALLEAEGVDLVFAPAAEEIYPAGGAGTFVEVPGIGERLDGASRPGHFRGVATVVAKLFHIVQPEQAYFGQKDAAQVAVLRAMVRDLNVPVELRVCPTVRDADGLALSSRNRYLSAEERVCALALPMALQRVREMVAQGICSRDRLRTAMLEELGGLRVDYAEVVDPDTLLPAETACGRALIAVAAWVGTTRLIDNVLLGGWE